MLSRLALRLAAAEALAPVGRLPSGPWPTIAGPRIYDSRQTPIDALDTIEARPLVILYTETTQATAYGSGPSRPDQVEVDLVCELMLAVRGQITLDLPDGTSISEGTLDTPIMERQHEALLDLLEAQVTRRLQGRTDVDAATDLFRKVAKSISRVDSVPTRDETRTVRLAARTVTFRVAVAADSWPAPSLAPATLTGLDILPDPLRSVAAALPADSSARAACELVASLILAPSALSALEAIEAGTALDGDSKADGRFRLSFTPAAPTPINLDFSVVANSHHVATLGL